MKEYNEIDFDNSIRSIMEDARESAPESVWEGVSATLKSRKAAVWWKWMPATAVALAAVAAVLVLSRPEVETSPIVTSNDKPAVTAFADVDIPSAEPVRIQEQAVKEAVAGIVSKNEIIIPETQEEIITEEEFSQEASAPEKEQVETRAKTKQNPVEKKAEEQRIDPFALMLAEDAAIKRESNKISLDLRGLVGSNELNGSFSGAFNGRMGVSALGSQAKRNTGVTDQSESEFGVPVSLGIGITIPLSKSFSLGTGIDYSCLTRTFTGTYSQYEDNVLIKSVTGDVLNTQHYIGIPLNLYYRLLESRKFKLYAFAGGEIEKGLADTYRINGSSATINYSTGMKGVQLSAGAGLGAEFLLTNHLGLFIDPSARYYFDCGQPKSIRTQKVLMFNVVAGLRFNL